jgi:hypothetical protein
VVKKNARSFLAGVCYYYRVLLMQMHPLNPPGAWRRAVFANQPHEVPLQCFAAG